MSAFDTRGTTPPSGYRDAGDLRVEGRVVAVDGQGIATVRFEDQAIRTKDGTSMVSVRGRTVCARRSKRMLENADMIVVGHHVAVLVPLTPTPRLCTIIHTEGR